MGTITVIFTECIVCTSVLLQFILTTACEIHAVSIFFIMASKRPSYLSKSHDKSQVQACDTGQFLVMPSNQGEYLWLCTVLAGRQNVCITYVCYMICLYVYVYNTYIYLFIGYFPQIQSSKPSHKQIPQALNRQSLSVQRQNCVRPWVERN